MIASAEAWAVFLEAMRRATALGEPDAWRTDAELEDIDRMAAAEFPGSFSARDGQVVEYAAVSA